MANDKSLSQIYNDDTGAGGLLADDLILISRKSGSNYVTKAVPANNTPRSVAGKTGAITLDKSDIGLSNVDNTSDASKPVSTAQQAALDLKANLASPALTGTPTAPTPTGGDSSTKIATTAFVGSALAGGATVSDGDKGNVTVSGGGTVWTLNPGTNANKIANGTVSNTEFQYLDGVTSAIQTQLNTKVQLSGDLAGTISSPVVKSRSVTATVGLTVGDFPVTSYANAVTAINAAVSFVNALGGGEVKLRAGNFVVSSSILLMTGVTLSGEGEATIITTSGTAFNCILADSANGCTVRDLKINAQSMRATAEPNGCAVKFTNGSVRGTVIDTYIVNARIGILFEQGASEGRIERNRIFNCRDNHIVVRKSTLANVATAQDTFDHIITNNFCDGLDVYDSITIYFTTGYAVISNNHIKNVVGTGSASAIQLEGGTGGLAPLVTVTGNIVRDCERALTVSSLSYATITGNAFYNSNEYGMKLQNSFYSDITDNIVEGSIRSGIWVVTNSRRLNIKGNYLINNGTLTNDAGLWLNQTSIHNVEGNFIQDNSDTGIYLELCSAVTVRGNYVNNNSGPQAQGIREANSSSSNNHFTDNYVTGSSGPNWTIVGGAGSTYHNNVSLNPIGQVSLGTVTTTATFNRQNGNSIFATLGGNITATVTPGRVKGDTLNLVFTQDATGGRTVAWPSNVLWKDSISPTLSSSPNNTDVLVLVWNGTDWVGNASSTAYTPTDATISTKGIVKLAQSLGGTADLPYVLNLVDTNGNKIIDGVTTASAVNYINATNAATTNAPVLQSAGSDTNIGVTLKSKGTGRVVIQAGGSSTTAIQVQSSGGSSIVNIDSTNSRMSVGLNATTPTSTLQIIGSFALPIRTVTANTTATATDHTILGDTTSAAFQLTLPTAVGITGRMYTLKRTNSGANNLTVGTTSSQTIDGSTTYVMTTQYKYITVQSDGANWVIIANN